MLSGQRCTGHSRFVGTSRFETQARLRRRAPQRKKARLPFAAACVETTSGANPSPDFSKGELFYGAQARSYFLSVPQDGHAGSARTAGVCCLAERREKRKA